MTTLEIRTEETGHLFLHVETRDITVMVPSVGHEITTHLGGTPQVVTRVNWHYTPGGVTITVYIRPKSKHA